MLDGAYDRFGELGRAVGVATDLDSDEAASQNFLKAVETICRELETPSLEEYGINKQEFMSVVDKMALDAMDSGSPQNSRKEVRKEDLEQIYRNLW